MVRDSADSLDSDQAESYIDLGIFIRGCGCGCGWRGLGGLKVRCSLAFAFVFSGGLILIVVDMGVITHWLGEWLCLYARMKGTYTRPLLIRLFVLETSIYVCMHAWHFRPLILDFSPSDCN